MVLTLTSSGASYSPTHLSNIYAHQQQHHSNQHSQNQHRGDQQVHHHHQDALHQAVSSSHIDTSVVTSGGSNNGRSSLLNNVRVMAGIGDEERGHNQTQAEAAYAHALAQHHAAHAAAQAAASEHQQHSNASEHSPQNGPVATKNVLPQPVAAHTQYSHHGLTHNSHYDTFYTSSANGTAANNSLVLTSTGQIINGHSGTPTVVQYAAPQHHVSNIDQVNQWLIKYRFLPKSECSFTEPVRWSPSSRSPGSPEPATMGSSGRSNHLYDSG